MKIYTIEEFDYIVRLISLDTGHSLDYIYSHPKEFSLLADCLIEVDDSFFEKFSIG